MVSLCRKALHGDLSLQSGHCLHTHCMPWATSVLACLATMLALEDGKALVPLTPPAQSEFEVGNLREMSFIGCILFGFLLLGSAAL